MGFTTFGLHADILRGVQDLRFTQPTAIQKEAIPPALAGRDLLACSATGSGKTAAFGLPILQRIMGKPRGVTRALILTPTRELAQQIEDHLTALAYHAKLTCASVYGGVGMGAQRHALEKGADIIIATPGRLLDHMRNTYARMKGLEVLVLDEADRMLDMGFMPDIQRILGYLPKSKQTLFFSATLPPPIVQLTRSLLKDPAAINIARQVKPAAGITQHVYPIAHTLKSSLLLRLVKDVKSVLVFTRTKRRADRVADYLARNGVPAARIHGDRTQGQRTQALDGFKRGKYRILVATDVAARGIDIDALSHVINFDLPGSMEDYVHRIGRTARAEAKGDAFTFVAPDEEREMKSIERALNLEIPRVKVAGFDYTAPEPHAGSAHARHDGSKTFGGRPSHARGGESRGGERGERREGREGRERGSYGRKGWQGGGGHGGFGPRQHKSHSAQGGSQAYSLNGGNVAHTGHSEVQETQEDSRHSRPPHEAKRPAPHARPARPWEKPAWKQRPERSSESN